MAGWRYNSVGGCVSCGCVDPNNGGGPVNLPTCVCQGAPATLALVVHYFGGETAATYANAYPDATLVYSPTGPPYPSPSTVAAYYSATTWVDDNGIEHYYQLGCGLVQYRLGHASYNTDQGVWQAPGQIYTWTMGGSPNPNTCVPFALVAGNQAAGFGPIITFSVTG